jgi:aspartate/methionine/tyrosine aminotransferase
MLTHNCARVTKWMDQAADRLQWIPPRAGAMAWMRYDHPLGSCELAERMRTDHSVLLVPGEHFGSEGWLRIGFGAQSDKLERGLERLATLLDTAAV